MDKRHVVRSIQSSLATELAELTESGAPDDGDARSERIKEIQGQLLMLKFLPLREYTDEDVVVPGALVELDFDGRRSHYLVVPSGGGLVTSIEGKPLQVLTPQSPIGEALVGRKAGETLEVAMRSGGPRRYRVVSVR